MDWQTGPVGNVLARPTDGKPVTSWADSDEAFADVARGIREAVSEWSQASQRSQDGTTTNLTGESSPATTQTGSVTHISSTASPNTPGAVAQFQVVFTTHKVLNANIDTITVLFDKDIGIPTSASKESVVISADKLTGGGAPNQPFNPNLDLSYRLVPNGEGAAEYTMTVPSMDKIAGGISNIAAGAGVTISFLTRAGFTVPTEATVPDTRKSPYSIKVKTSEEPDYVANVDGQEFRVPLVLSLDKLASTANKALTVFGKGFKGGTFATIWLDADQDGVRDSNEADLITVPIARSCDCFEATFVVTVPPFRPGKGNVISAIDGENSSIKIRSRMPSFEVQGFPKTTPRPPVFGGTATLYGATAGNGTVVSAWIDGVQVASTTVTAGSYAFAIAQLPGKFYVGKKITFRVGTGIASQTGTWEIDGGNELNLTATS